jgi:hypothetical protein
LPPQLQRELPTAAQFASEYTAMSLVKLRKEHSQRLFAKNLTNKLRDIRHRAKSRPQQTKHSTAW